MDAMSNELIPEFRFDVKQNVPVDDPNTLWGFGFFLIFEWRF